MTQGKRIKEIRKTLGLTLAKFGERIGLQDSSISSLEKGINSVTESTRKAICREFNINYEWLVSGEGEMFEDENSELKSRIDTILLNGSDFHIKLLKHVLYMNRDELKTVEGWISMCADLEKN